MGSACTSLKVSSTETLIKQIFTHPSFKLSRLTYEGLLQLLNSISPENSVTQAVYQSLLLLLLNQSSPSTKYTSYHTQFFAYAQQKLSDHSTTQSIALLFFPFLLKDSQSRNSFNLYNSFKASSDKNVLTIGLLKQMMYDYLSFCSKELTYIVWNTCNDSRLIGDLDRMNTNAFSERKIKELRDSIIEESQTSAITADTEVSYEAFDCAYKRYDIGSYLSIRKMLM